MTDKPFIVKCSYGCGKTCDMTYQARIHKRLGFNPRPKWQCAECFKREWPKIEAADEVRREAYRKVREAQRAAK